MGAHRHINTSSLIPSFSENGFVVNKFWLCILLAAVSGSACGWAVNYGRYGHRTARFGPFTMEGEVTPETALAAIDKQVPDKLGRVEMPDGPKYDFGAMAPGEKGEHVFIVKNVGNGNLNLRIGAATCKCTIGSLDKESIAPGEEAEIKLEWEVQSDKTDFSQSAQLITNDPGKVVINLGISGKVIRELEIVPAEWSFGEVAAGEPIELSGTLYNFMEEDIKPTRIAFSDETLTGLSEFDVEAFSPTEESDGVYAKARQGFRVKVHVKGGLRQGALSQNFMFGFRKLDKDGNELSAESGQQTEDPNYYAVAKTTGRIIGKLGLLAGSRVRGETGGGFVYDFGRIGKDDSLIGKTFVVLKGNERENTKLRIGEISPEGVVKAKLGEPKGRGSMTLFPLEIELTPGSEQIARLGKNADDYGNVWIESDNPKVTKMRIALKFVIEPR